MRADLPYNFCEAPECHEMVPRGDLFCKEHEHLARLSPIARQEQLNTTTTVSGDAVSKETKS